MGSVAVARTTYIHSSRGAEMGFGLGDAVCCPARTRPARVGTEIDGRFPVVAVRLRMQCRSSPSRRAGKILVSTFFHRIVYTAATNLFLVANRRSRR